MMEHTCPGYATDPPEIQTALDDGGFWIGCEHPERLVDTLMVTIGGCPGCSIAAEAAKRRGMFLGTENTVEGVVARVSR